LRLKAHFSHVAQALLPAASALMPTLVRRARKRVEMSLDTACRSACATLVLLAVLSLAGCRQDMQDQPKFIPLRPSTFFDDGRSERPLIDGTVARGHLNDDVAFYTGMGPDGKPADTFPFAVTREVMDRGQERYDIYCAPCHDRTGAGNGMIVRRGYKQPPSYYSDRVRQLANGAIYDTITRGFGAMPDYAAQISPRDRWAIVAYVRALQASESATIDDVPAGERAKLEAAK
jgi:mono/diheme cytochrome c family protein